MMVVGGGGAYDWVCVMVAASACRWWLSMVVAVNCEMKRKRNTTPEVVRRRGREDNLGLLLILP